MRFFSKNNLLLLLCIGFFSCQEDNTLQPLEPKSLTYLIHRTGYNAVQGDVVFTELSPGILTITITLENTDPRFSYPAHLHFGTIGEVGELAMRLSDVNGVDGISSTRLDHASLSNGELVSLDLINQMNGSVKVHLSSGVFKNTVLAFGNIGKNKNFLSDGVAICTGH